MAGGAGVGREFECWQAELRAEIDREGFDDEGELPYGAVGTGGAFTVSELLRNRDRRWSTTCSPAGAGWGRAAAREGDGRIEMARWLVEPLDLGPEADLAAAARYIDQGSLLAWRLLEQDHATVLGAAGPEDAPG